MPRLIYCCDQEPGEEPVLDSQAYWIRLPDGTRARGTDGKLLAYKYRENASAAAEVLAGLYADGMPQAVPPEPHELPPAVNSARSERTGRGR